VFLLFVLIFGDSMNFGSHDLRLFIYTCLAYFVAAALFAMYLRAGRLHFNLQLSLHLGGGRTRDHPAHVRLWRPSAAGSA